MKFDFQTISKALGFRPEQDRDEETVKVCIECGVTEVIYCGLSGQDKLGYCSSCHLVEPGTKEITMTEYIKRQG